MKINLVLIISVLLLTVSCQSKVKKTDVAEETSKKEVENEQKQFSEDDYATFSGAAFENKGELVREMISQGIDVNHVDANKTSALMLAAYNGHLEVVNLLLAAGADVSKVDMTNRTALMFASTGPFVETVKVLLAAGANVNATDSQENWTPVMWAAAEGQMEVLKVLIAAGGDITMVDIDGESSYDFALSNQHQEVADYLKELAQKK